MLFRAARLSLVAWTAALATVLGVGGRPMAESAQAMHPARAEARERLRAVVRWGCQYQRIDLAALAQSNLDLLVIEPIVDGATGRPATLAEIEALQRRPDGTRRLVLAYLSVGAAEEWRAYWRDDWKTGRKPTWLGPENAEWPRSYAVRYWEEDWQQLLDAAVARLVATGYDGVFLDRVDAFHDWRERASAEADMSALVERLARRARSQTPGFLIIGQNAEQLLRDERYVDAIDGISKESLLTGLSGQDVRNSPEDVEWSLSHLRAVRQAGLAILAIEYAQSEDLARSITEEHKQLGHIPFIGNRLLDRIP